MKLPEKFAERMKNDLKDDFESFLECYEKEPYNALRVNTLKLSPYELKEIAPYVGKSVPWCKDGFYYDGKKGNTIESIAGLFYSQEPSAMISAECAMVRENDFVLDLCAAPGGKSTQIASYLNGTGLLLSNEVSFERAKILCRNIERMGIKNAVVTNMYPDKLEKLFEGFFDKIIVDAPCSGEGMFRKDPVALEMWTEDMERSCSVRQRAILESAVKMLRPGGRMVYSTCTFSKKENEEMCSWFEESFDDIRFIEMHRMLPHKIEGEGHFCAVFEKDGEGKRPLRKESIKAKKEITEVYRDFERENLNTTLEGDMVLFGDKLYLLPHGFGSLDKIKCLLAGLCLGEVRKGRFIPDHHLCMALKKEDFKRTISLENEEIRKYFKGETIPTNSENGFGAVLFNDRYPVGWYKCSNNQAKNHYPKYLRG